MAKELIFAGGIDPPPQSIYNHNVSEVLSTCKKCGKSHGMVIEEKATGKMTPIDFCKDCLWYGTFIPIHDQIELRDVD